MEKWRAIPQYEGMYEVSSCGNVRSVTRETKMPANGRDAVCVRKGTILKMGEDRKGYLRVKLYGSHGNSTKRVHRLVAEAFIPNPMNKPQVNHINGVKSDNRVENLEWVSQSENIRHSYDVLLNKSKGAPGRKVRCLENGVVYPSISLAARELKLEATNICRVCKGKMKTTGGLHFLYEPRR